MKRAYVVVLVAIAAAFVWWLTSGDVAAVPPDGTAHAATSDADTAPAKAATQDEPIEPEAAAPAERESVEAPPAAPLATEDEAVLFGRCVDEEGEPIAGVTVELHGWVGNDQRLNAYRQEHGDVVWDDPEDTVTGADGRFERRFVPPPPYQFVLDLEIDGRVPVGGRWGKIDPGTRKDLGDVVLAQGAIVSGRVVDTDGVPRKGVRVSIDRHNRKDGWRGEMKPEERYYARSQADGTFRFEKPVTPDTWNLDLRYGQLAEPREEVIIAAPTTTLEVVVKRDADIQFVTGLVVDQHGQPIHGVHVDPEGRSGGGWITSTKKDGTFRLERRASGDPDGPFALRFEHRHCEHLRTEQKYEWGARDIRVEMRRGVEVVLTVTRADDGRPVEEFGTRILPDAGSSGGWSSSYARVRGGWKHEGGRQVLQGVRRGRHNVIVEPRASTGLARSETIPIEVGANGPVPVAVQLHQATDQQVRVVDASGKAMADSKVELVDLPADEPLEPQTHVEEIGGWNWMRQNRTTLASSATTDANGLCTVRGAVQRAYGLRVTGVAHVPVTRTGVVLEGDVLEIVVPTGGTLHVTLGPPELLADLYRQAMLPLGKPADARRARKRPGIMLRRRIGNAYEKHPSTEPGFVPFDDESKLTIGGIPPGTWDVLLHYTAAYDDRSYSTMDDIVRTGLVVESGGEQEIALDLPQMQLGKLAGTLRINGEPSAQVIQLVGDCGVMADGQPRIHHRNANSDAEGRFEALLPTGTWRAQPYVQIGDRHLPTKANGAVQIVAGKDARADYDVRTVTAPVRVLTADGKPVQGVRLSFVRDGELLGTLATVTDAEGRTTVTTTPGSATLKLRIRSLQDRAKMQEFWKKNGLNAQALAAIEVAAPPIVFTAGVEDEIEIRMPAEWDR